MSKTGQAIQSFHCIVSQLGDRAACGPRNQILITRGLHTVEQRKPPHHGCQLAKMPLEMLRRMRIRNWYKHFAACSGLALLLLAWVLGAREPESFRFAILGDRTGEAQAGIYEQVWKEIAAEKPAFVISVGDTIEGLNDKTAPAEWREFDQILEHLRQYPLYLAPGNHDVWSATSERLFRQHAPGLHYSFDYGEAHFTVLDNSRSDELTNEELLFVETDLKIHAAQPFKMIISHRPSWLLYVGLQNPNFPLHRIARRYGVQFVIAGHVHQMMHSELQGVTYVSIPSSGGHLRLSRQYERGWLFGHALIELNSNNVKFEIREVDPPHGEGRITMLAAWGMNGLAPQ